MGRWPTKEERRAMKKRIRQLRDEDKLKFSVIAERMGLNYVKVLREYYSKEK